jgi:Asp-tRNA(Asn)/Glu-tRNA(Gln) amidotransferase A subunit family amidase
LKPSSHRLSFAGHSKYVGSFDGQINIPPVMGPMGKSVDDLALFMKVMTSEKYYTRSNRDPYRKIFTFDH